MFSVNVNIVKLCSGQICVRYSVPLLCRTDLIFGNLEEIWEFHADTLLPQLESCHLNPTLIAKTFLEYCQHLTRMYCRSVVWVFCISPTILETAHLYLYLLNCST